MKSILISIKPRYVADILNHKKTIEVRKSKPNVDLPIDVYIYCTKDNSNGYLYYSFGKTVFHDKYVLIKEYDKQCIIGSGKVVAKFTLNKVEEIRFENHNSYCCDDPLYPETDSLSYDELLDKSCTKALPYGETEIGNYIGEKGYAWHISNLVIFDRPRELGEFKIPCDFKCPELGCCYCHKNTRLTKAPQSYQFIEVEGDK